MTRKRSDRTWQERNPRMGYWLRRSEYHPVANPAPINPSNPPPALPDPNLPNPPPVPPNPEPAVADPPPPPYSGNAPDIGESQISGSTTKPPLPGLLRFYPPLVSV